MKQNHYHHGDLRQTLLKEGLALLEEQGLTGLSLRAIAARAGVSHAAPKNHFRHLQGLTTAMAAEGFRLHVTYMQAGLTDNASREERLHAALQGYVRFSVEHPHLFTLMFTKHHCDFTDPELIAASQASYAVLADVADGLEWKTATGEKPSAAQTELMLWSLVHGYAKLLQTGRIGPHSPVYNYAQSPDILSLLPAFN